MRDDEPLIDLEALLNPEEQQVFRRLCLPTSIEELTQLPDVVELHLDHIRTSGEANTDVEMAEAIGTSLTAVLAEADAFGDHERALVRGAVEYFLLAEDASGDLNDVLGFDDDARVLNAVLSRLDRPQYRIELG